MKLTVQLWGTLIIAHIYLVAGDTSLGMVWMAFAMITLAFDIFIIKRKV